MTFEELFAGRLTLMRAQRHIAQAHVLRYEECHNTMQPVFRGPEGRDAFWLVERQLIELELDFTEKRKTVKPARRKRLDRRANRQVVTA